MKVHTLWQISPYFTQLPAPLATTVLYFYEFTSFRFYISEIVRYFSFTREAYNGAVEAKAWLSKTVTNSEEAYRGCEPELPQEAELPRAPICLLICTGEAAAVCWTWQTCVPYGVCAQARHQEAMQGRHRLWGHTTWNCLIAFTTNPRGRQERWRVMEGLGDMPFKLTLEKPTG